MDLNKTGAMGAAGANHMQTSRASDSPERRGNQVLVVFENGPCESPDVDHLRREHEHVHVVDASYFAKCRTLNRHYDVVLLYSNKSGSQCRELLDKITRRDPLIPVIVIACTQLHAGGSTRGRFNPVIDHNTGGHEAGLVLQAVREVLREPKIKRLIRVTERNGKATYLARNARWLAQDRQMRYSTPFEWSLPPTLLPGKIERTGDAPPSQL